MYREVIAKAIAECADEPLDEVSSRAFYADADQILATLLSAPDSVRQELATLLNPWRPIETAPKDGSFYIGYFPTESHPDDVIRLSYWLPHRLPKATHWLPIPAPPSEDET
jgi:hypothetical protein